jgi:flagellar motor switch protein FliG
LSSKGIIMQNEVAITRGPMQDVAPGTPKKNPVAKVLNGRAKAAVVVRLLLNEGADLPLEELPEDLQALLTKQMGKMGMVDRTTLAAVVQEFADTLDGVGLSFPNGLAGALTAMDGKISPQTAARLRKEAGVRQAGDPWERLRGLPTEELVELARAESIEVAAVLLSKLDVESAAAMLGKMPGPLARRITLAVSRTGSVTPETVDRIGLALAGQLDLKPIVAFDDGPDERIGAILNLSTALTRDDLLSGLDEADEDFANAVRRTIFTFAHVPARLAARDVPKLTREVEQAILVTALQAAKSGDFAETAEFLLSNTSTRMADSLREEMTERGTVALLDGETAMTAVIAAIRRLELAGDIQLNVQVEPEKEE